MTLAKTVLLALSIAAIATTALTAASQAATIPNNCHHSTEYGWVCGNPHSEM